MRTKCCVCVGRIGDDYYFVNSIFDHGDGFRGCTGFAVRPVSSDEYKWASDPENIAERYLVSWEKEHGKAGDYGCEECGGYPDQEFGCNLCGIPSLDEWIAEWIEVEGVDDLMFDTSYCCDVEPFFDALGVEYECTDYCGAWIFHDSEFDEYFNRKAYRAVLAYEGGYTSYEKAVEEILLDN